MGWPPQISGRRLLSIVRYSFMQSIRDILFEQRLENIAEQQWWERNLDL